MATYRIYRVDYSTHKSILAENLPLISAYYIGGDADENMYRVHVVWTEEPLQQFESYKVWEAEPCLLASYEECYWQEYNTINAQQ